MKQGFFMIFEDYFSELQADMVSICLEYVQGKADKIYIYAAFEPRVSGAGCFFSVKGKLVQRHLVNQEIPEVNLDHQIQVLDILMKDLEKLNSICQKFNQPMPTEIKMIYDVKKNSLSANYQYNLILSFESELLALPQDVEDAWFEEIKNQMEDN